VEGVSAERVCLEAAELGVESMPLSAYYQDGGPGPNALVLGFGAVSPAASRAAVAKLGVAIERARRGA
jgi:DNA-binding transcriptional MocR family regulator